MNRSTASTASNALMFIVVFAGLLGMAVADLGCRLVRRTTALGAHLKATWHFLLHPPGAAMAHAPGRASAPPPALPGSAAEPGPQADAETERRAWSEAARIIERASRGVGHGTASR